MKKRVRLTAGRVKEFQCPADKPQVFLWDSDAPGFALRATMGAKAYIFQGRLAGKSIRITIGDINAWGIDDARQEARRLQLRIDQGRDPRVMKAEATAADAAKAAQAVLSSEPALVAWKVYLSAREGKWSPRTLLDHQRLSTAGGKAKTRGRKKGEGDTTQAGPLFSLLQLSLVAIDREAVTAWLQEQQHRPTVARGAFVRLRAFLNWCEEMAAYKDLVQSGACSTRVMQAELPKAQAKSDCLQREQLPLWFEHVQQISSPVIRAYLQAALLTGARREELANLRWTDVDFQWNSLTIRDKVEGQRIIPLTPYVKALLVELQGLNNAPPKVQFLDGAVSQKPEWMPSPWVFFSARSASGRIQEPRAAHNKAIQAAGLPHLTIHGLRRSFGTLAEWEECPTGIVAQIQGHKPSAVVEKHYRRRPLDLLRKWHTKIEAWILNEAGICFDPEARQPLRVLASA